tara:strand:- start:547 stop:720 length:174 start_codon:yes stop_codon:yes gene_type:complete
MITIKQNPNFGKFFQVFAFGKFVDELDRKGKAVRLATRIAKSHKLTMINIEGRMEEI